MIIYGASGHGKVVKSAYLGEVLFFFDDNPAIDKYNDLKVFRYERVLVKNESLVVAIGDNEIRKKVVARLNHKFGRVIAKTAEVDSTAEVGLGSQILHGAIIQVDATVGEHSIINTGASIDHDCAIGSYCHIAPKVTLCGNVQVGNGTLIGAGAVVLPGVKIGENCIVGAGSVVIEDIRSNTVSVGSPARIIRINE
jgi:sugar O-acyltransferase (sialic acid O-acetyltransferase NeuD family)